MSEPLGGICTKADFADTDDLDLPFGDGAITITPDKPAAPAKQKVDDILSSINFAAA